MNIKKFIPLIIVALFTFTTACGPDYNIDFPPPDSKASPNLAFPPKIDDKGATLKQLSFPKPNIGFQANYDGDTMEVQIIQSPNADEANNFFKNTIVPEFDKLNTHSRAQVNGKWYASGKTKDGHKWYGWVNQNWSFVIKAKDEKHFNKLIEALPYISK